ncbi:MAG: AMP-binding protein [Rhizobiales bacterium]|nr:AMP-binding protein [Hyphomicrobiales bacterium]
MVRLAPSIARGYQGELPPKAFNLARYCLADNALRQPDKLALMVVTDASQPLEQAECWTYGELDHAVRAAAAGYLAHGLKPGDRILIRMPNTSLYAIAFFGAMAAGLVPLPSSNQLTDHEAAFLEKDSRAALVVDEKFAKTLSHNLPQSNYANTLADDPAFLVYTSGTSGRPKGVLHAHRSAWGRRPMYQGWYGISAADRILHAGAFNWTYTLGVGLTDPWANGATTILYNGPKDVHIWPQLMERTRATLFAAVPTLYRQILKYTDLTTFDLSALRHGLTAGEALSPALLAHWQEVTGKNLYEALGMSECSTYISTSPSMVIRPGSPGKPQPGRCVAVLPVEEGIDPLPAGQTGLLAVHRSDPGLMLGYWGRPEEEADVYRGEWFIGGDLASFDEDGYLWYQGRADDLMNAMGYRVSPQEVEAAFLAHPDVAEVAVREKPVREDVSIIAAYVVVKEGCEKNAETLLDFVRQALAAYKCPREIIFIEQLPRTANGKVMRRALPLD